MHFPPTIAHPDTYVCVCVCLGGALPFEAGNFGGREHSTQSQELGEQGAAFPSSSVPTWESGGNQAGAFRCQHLDFRLQKGETSEPWVFQALEPLLRGQGPWGPSPATVSHR